MVATSPVRELSMVEKAALLGGKTVWESRDLPRVGIRSLFFADGPHGVRRQVGSSDHLGLNGSEPSTCFPTAATIANSWDETLAEEIGAALGVEAAALGVDVLLGPGLNLKRSPLAGRNFEYFSEDPYLSGRLAAGYVRGIQAQDVAATPKHFALNNQELRRMTSDSVVDERTMRELYLTAFEIVVRESSPRAIMTAYNLVNGEYANENAHLLRDILREEWGFDGAVVTDWGGASDIVAGAAAGGGIVMPAPGLAAARRLVEAVESGALDAADLDARAAETLALVRPATARPEPRFDEHHRLAQRAAEESIVLLRNEDALLPLASGTRVALIGDLAETPRYQGAGSSLVNPTRLTRATEEVAASDLELVAFERGYRRDAIADAALLRSAVDAARSADVAIVHLGLDEASESEGVDRTHLRLPANQLDLLRAVLDVQPHVVVVLSAGSVVELDGVDQAPAIVHGYLGGQAGAAAMVRVLTGAVAPSGRLAETYPIALSDTPTAGRFPVAERVNVYREGPFIGYRYYEAAGVDVRFPFGHGLSYASFAYDDLAIEEDHVAFTVTNTSSVAGAEVAQLYVRAPESRLLRPEKELKGFAKVRLEPGESARVRVPFDRYTWRHFDATDGWQTEAGPREVLVGASSADIRLRGALELEGAQSTPDYHVPTVRAALLRGATNAEYALLLGRPVPAEVVGTALTADDPLSAMNRARGWVGRLGSWVLETLQRRSARRRTPDLNLQFTYHMPFRALARMSGGALDDAGVAAILTIVNGRFFAGAAALIRALVRNRRANAATLAELTTRPEL